MRILFFLLINFLLVVVAFHSFALADGSSFSIEIVGRRQVPSAAGDQGNGPDYPSIEMPRMSVQEDISRFDPIEAMQGRGEHSFFVIIRNTSTKPIKLWVLMSDLFNSLSFDITRPDGSTIHINRNQREWDKNFPVSWYFAPNGVRVLCVDFTTSSWDRTPENLVSANFGLCKMKATFTYRQAADPAEIMFGKDGKITKMTIKPAPDSASHTFQSAETEVVATVLE